MYFKSFLKVSKDIFLFFYLEGCHLYPLWHVTESKYRIKNRDVAATLIVHLKMPNLSTIFDCDSVTM